MSLIQETIALFKGVRSSMVQAMQNLYTIRESGEWEKKYDSWGEFIEDGLGISQGFASKLLSVNQHYLLDAGVSPSKITGVDYEKLYMASKLSGSVEQQIAKASTLDRSELRRERDDSKDHTHEWIEICKHCSMRKP